MQSAEFAFRGQFAGEVIAETVEVPRHAASLVRVDYQARAHDVELRSDRDDLYAPDHINPSFDTDSIHGDVDAALVSAAVTLDATYTTPMEHHNPLEPSATIPISADEGLTIYCATQGVHVIRETVASLFELDPLPVRVISPHVCGRLASIRGPHTDV